MVFGKDSNRKNLIILGIAFVVFVLCIFISRCVQTAGFSVTVQDVSMFTDDGVMMEGTLYIPSNATSETPAAGVLIAPGGNTPHVFYQSYSAELARRGYVVFAYDYYGAGKSSFSPVSDQGALAAMKYLTSLSFVDNGRLAATGHSNGGAQATAAITSEYVPADARKAVMFIGCGISSTDLTVYNDISVGCIWGTLDEAGQGTFWDTYHEDAYNLGSFPELAGVESSEVVFDTWYGDPGANSGRILFVPNTFHSMSNLLPRPVASIISFIDSSIGGNVTDLEPDDQIAWIHEISTLFAAIALCVMFFPLGSILLGTGFFSKVKRPVRERSAKLNLKFWLFLLVPPVLSALIVKTTIIQGQTIMGYLPSLFKVQSTNGFIWWFFLSSLITVAFMVIRCFADKDFDKTTLISRLKISVPDFFRTLLLALIIVFIPYFIALVGERLFSQYPRIFQTYFASMTAERVWQYPVYFIMFSILFLVSAYSQAEALRIKGRGEVSYYILSFFANSLPAVLFLGYLFGDLVLTHTTLVNGREMSRAQGAMMGMLLLYFIIAKVVTYFYEKSGNIYLIAFINAGFVTWLSVNTPQLIC